MTPASIHIIIPSPQARLRLTSDLPNFIQTLALHPTSALPTSWHYIHFALPTSSQTPDLAELLGSPRDLHAYTFQDSFEVNSSGSNYLLGTHSNPLLHQLHIINSNPFLILKFNCRVDADTTLLVLP